MKKYYTRACNFYYGKISRQLIEKKKAFPLCGNKDIAFNQIEVFIRKNKNISSKIINIKDINFQNKIWSKKNYFKKKILSWDKNYGYFKYDSW